MTDRLRSVLASLQAYGAIGPTSLDAAIAHADRFVRALPTGPVRVVDLGSGGGLPGLVIAARRPDLTIVLVERRQRRADLLQRAVGALGLGAEVRAADVAELAATDGGAFDVVTARSFGPPLVTAGWAARLLRPGGVALISEPPDAPGNRWPSAQLEALGLRDEGVTDGIRHLRRDVPRET